MARTLARRLTATALYLDCCSCGCLVMQCFTMESGEVHDRVTGAVQNATHAALLTFGTARPARPSMTRSLL